MANVVGERFQITIDKHVRDQLGIKPGDQAVERVEDGRLVVDFLRQHSESMLGILKKLSDVPIAPITNWRKVKDDAWGMRVAEIVDGLGSDTPGRRRAPHPDR